MRKWTMEELGRKSVPEFKAAPKRRIAVVLDNLRSMANVGALFRISDAFLLEQIYLCGITACPPHREIQKTALGATETVAWKYEAQTSDALTYLLSQNYHLLAVEQTDESVDLATYLPPQDTPLAVIFGSEVGGVSDEALALCHQAVEIPQFGAKHSLNVAVTAGIVLYKLTQSL